VGFVVVLAYLGVLVNEFICNQRERKEMHTDVFLCSMQYGTRGKCPLFTCKNFFLTLLKYRFVLMSVFNKTDK